MVRRGLRPWWPRWASVGLVGAFFSLALVAGPAFALPSPQARLSYEGSGSVRGQVTWNGVDVDKAGSPSSSLSSSLTNAIHLVYSWAAPATSPSKTFTISDARLQMLYFGQSLSTRDVVASNPAATTNGTMDMDWSPPAVLHYLVAGSYEMVASLLAPNGTTMWTEHFYIDASAPFVIGAAIPILLIVVGLYEVYGLLVSGRQDRPKPPTAPKGWKPKEEGTETPADGPAAGEAEA